MLQRQGCKQSSFRHWNRPWMDSIKNKKGYSMIFKVLIQDSLDVPPMRERTRSLFIEADSVRDVRSKLAGRNHNIEYIQEITGVFLEFEKRTEQFEVER